MHYLYLKEDGKTLVIRDNKDQKNYTLLRTGTKQYLNSLIEMLEASEGGFFHEKLAKAYVMPRTNSFTL